MARKKKKDKMSMYKTVGAICVAVVLIIFLIFIYSSVKKMQNDVFNVRQTVTEQNQDAFEKMQSEIDSLKKELAEKERRLTEFYGVYVNKEIGVQFEIPTEEDQKSGLVDDENLVMFGPFKDFDGVVLPKYTLRVFEKSTIDDYKQRIAFRDETCSPNVECIMFDYKYTELAEDRELALAELFTEKKIGDYQVWEISLANECALPTVLIYNVKDNSVYEFQEYCSEDEKLSYEKLEKVIEGLTFL